MHDSIAHTAEHAFVGSIQHMLGETLRVRKVDHKGVSNTAVIVIPNLELQTVLDAQAQVNDLIRQGRKVIERTFESLEEARNAIPGLRANEERISGQVRVVEIEGHDAAACALPHAKDLSECDFFLVTRLSRNGSEFEVDFAVGKHAKDMALSLSSRLLKVCSELGANVNTVENTAKKVKAEAELSRKKLRSLGMEKLAKITPRMAGKFTLLAGTFSDLNDDDIIEYAGSRVTSERLAVIIANESPDGARIVLARNESEPGPDLNALFKRIAGSFGRGGGKPHFVTGMIKKDAIARVMDEMSAELAKLN